jgi:sec-independent protein translocase protein TatA
MMLPFGPFEFVIILVIFMIFFGAGKLGDLGGAIRRGVALFKQNAGIGDADKKDEKKRLKG